MFLPPLPGGGKGTTCFEGVVARRVEVKTVS